MRSLNIKLTEAFILHLTQKFFCPWFMTANHAAEGTITVFKMKNIASHKLYIVNSVHIVNSVQ